MRTKQHSNTEARLGAIIDQLQESGRYWFTREDIAEVRGGSEVAFRQAALRLQRQSRIVMPRRGFYVIVPLEYRSAGAPPPAWFIDALMAFQERPYYVGLLSAAALHGAAHQQAQEFQVVTDQALRPAVSGKTQLRFFVKKSAAQTPTVGMKVETGTMQVSTPEATAFDLVRYPWAVGGLGNIATVFADLVEKIDSERLVRVAAEEPEIAAIQRAGLLLESAGAGDTIRPLSEWLAARKPRTVALRADRNVTGAERNQHWRVLVNERIEVDE